MLTGYELQNPSQSWGGGKQENTFENLSQIFKLCMFTIDNINKNMKELIKMNQQPQFLLAKLFLVFPPVLLSKKLRFNYIHSFESCFLITVKEFSS